jgi:putative (di)nucleoside polyphosphate hydrolase
VSEKEEKPYRPNVGMVVFNREGKLLAGERIQYPDAWQFPQGGIDEGENPDDASKRELFEEVGISNPELVAIFPEWIHYDFPPNMELKGKLANYKGQVQRWYLYYWNHNSSDCNLELHEREFIQVKFMSWKEIIDSIVAFKKDIYKQLQPEFSSQIEKFLTTQNRY